MIIFRLYCYTLLYKVLRLLLRRTSFSISVLNYQVTILHNLELEVGQHGPIDCICGSDGLLRYLIAKFADEGVEDVAASRTLLPISSAILTRKKW